MLSSHGLGLNRRMPPGSSAGFAGPRDPRWHPGRQWIGSNLRASALRTRIVIGSKTRGTGLKDALSQAIGARCEVAAGAPAQASAEHRQPHSRRPAERWAAPVAIGLATVAIATWAIREVLTLTGGIPAVPLDDAYIHFQFARSFAEGHPFVYSPGGPATPGASSLLWAGSLAVFYALGFTGSSIVWPAWILGWGFLGLLAWEVSMATRELLDERSRWCATAAVLSCGGLAWSAGSGMAVVPLSWLLLRTARRAADWLQAPDATQAHRRAKRQVLELVVLALAGPLMRPEGALTSLIVAAVFCIRSPARSRFWGVAALSSLALPTLLNWAFTGQFASTTLAAKWLFTRPYPALIEGTVREHLRLLFTVLFRGEEWARYLAPEASAIWAWLALPALLWRGHQQRRFARAALLALVGLGILIPVTYHSFLWNRLRYLWPFVPVWLVGVVALGDVVASYASRLWPPLRRWGFVVGLCVVVACGRGLPNTIADLATSSDAIRRQQVSLGIWAKTAIWPGVVIGVNDAGAIAYFSDHQIFDFVGLTTLGEARYWSAGAGSRFEHYEELGAARLPTHLIVYPQWWQLDALSGERLTARTVYSSILGGFTMEARIADYSLLGSAALPVDIPATASLEDELDVAHLEQEAAHGYELFNATPADNQLVAEAGHADGARMARIDDVFTLKLVPGGHLVARVGAEAPCSLQVQMGTLPAQQAWLSSEPWQELSWSVPANLPPGPTQVRFSASRSFTSMHYWSFGRPLPHTGRPARSFSTGPSDAVSEIPR